MVNKQIKNNFSFAFAAQGASFIVSCITNLILPKILGTIDFSYWQLFIFYSSYIPCLAFGINDGVYLRYGGESRDTLDYKSVKSQYLFGIIYQLIIAVIIGVITVFVIEDARRKLTIELVLIYYLIYTCHNFLGYIFQAINETHKYSKSIILNRVIYLIVQTVFLFIGYIDVFVFILFYILSMGSALLYLIICIRQNFRDVKADLSYGKNEAIISIKTGISLMISNLCAMFVTGVGRQIIDMRWGILVFGKVSFSLTLINFALAFISQISMVLFPALRRLEVSELKTFYRRITAGLFFALPFMYVLYLPGKCVLNLWLPEYAESMEFLTVILPICFFDCKMNLIGNTFFKVLGKQVMLLKINFTMIFFSGGWGLFSAYVLNNIQFVIIGMVAAIMFRSVIADIILSKQLQVNIIKYEIFDIILAVIFIMTANTLNPGITFAVFVIVISLRFIIIKSLTIEPRI